MNILRAKALASFVCLGDACEDTCCRGWSMQVDEGTLERYRARAPELLDAVEPASEAACIMRKFPETAHCVKLEAGLCAIHRDHGSDFLGDACHFYPRVPRMLANRPVMTAALSCPEIARLALREDGIGLLLADEPGRWPHTLKDSLPSGADADEALALHELLLAGVLEDGLDAETAALRLVSVAGSLENLPAASWPAAGRIYWQGSAALVPPPEPVAEDPFNLLHALCGLMSATRLPLSARLLRSVADIEACLSVAIDWQEMRLEAGENSLPAWQAALEEWDRGPAEHYAPLLRRWLHAQLSQSLFPYGGLGGGPRQRAVVIAVRLATVKLAFMAATHKHGGPLNGEEDIRIVQSLSRLLDHLADVRYSWLIYEETGWTRDSRLRSLLNC